MKNTTFYLFILGMFTLPIFSEPFNIPEITWETEIPADVTANGPSAVFSYALNTWPLIQDYFKTHIKNLISNLLEYIENNYPDDETLNKVNALRALAEPLNPDNEEALHFLMMGTGLFLQTNYALFNDPAQLGFTSGNPHYTFNQIYSLLTSYYNPDLSSLLLTTEA